MKLFSLLAVFLVLATANVMALPSMIACPSHDTKLPNNVSILRRIVCNPNISPDSGNNHYPILPAIKAQRRDNNYGDSNGGGSAQGIKCSYRRSPPANTFWRRLGFGDTKALMESAQRYNTQNGGATVNCNNYGTVND